MAVDEGDAAAAVGEDLSLEQLKASSSERDECQRRGCDAGSLLRA